ncbi:response regulator [Fimbriiglobus ruber]|uniref:histidine kinase n=1 Tax=Fimbriiglobus ruber TaxID=1908690 RepID=A0A225DDA8_9BACT|nr:response regulator [Fimbriiglobus ruber]OWK37624.1 Two-component hybrid sensor and regulator [Fimbriiglobus ruber]
MADDLKTKILVVDDLPEKLLVYRTILEELGQELVSARSGEEALREVLRSDFAVILLDVNMPGMGGLETAGLIRSRKRSAHTPIIFLTSFADEVRAAEGYAQGAVDYIPMPVVPAILRAKVNVFVELYRMTQQVKRQAEERIALVEERTRREAAEDANRRLAFLTRAGEVLGLSLDQDITVRDVVTLPIPLLADVAAIVILKADGSVARTVVGRAGESGPVVDDKVAAAALPAAVRAAIDRTTGGATVHVKSPAGSVVALPLRARGRTFAVLGLSCEPSGRTLPPSDVAVAEALASRAAVALDNAGLYHDVQQADRQKNEFLSMLAHELRNPLAPIRNASEVLRRLGSDQPRSGGRGT